MSQTNTAALKITTEVGDVTEISPNEINTSIDTVSTSVETLQEQLATSVANLQIQIDNLPSGEGDSNNSGGGKVLGEIFTAVLPFNVFPKGAVKPDGATYTKSLFPDVYQAILDNKIFNMSLEDYASQVTQFGRCIAFGIDATTETFRVPLLKDGDSIKVAMSELEIGKSYNAGLPNIEGGSLTTYIASPSEFEPSTSGSITTRYTTPNAGVSSGTGRSYGRLYLDASLSSSIYQNDVDTVLTEQARLPYFVQIASGTENYITSGIPLGYKTIWSEPYLPTGAIYANGDLIENFDTIYATWYNDYLITNEAQVKPLSEWTDTLVYWNEWYVDTTTGTVRVPKPAPYMSGDGTDSTLGNYVEAGLPNITGQYSFGANTSSSVVGASINRTGAFISAATISNGTFGLDTRSSGTPYNDIGFNASRSNTIYGNSDTVSVDHTVGRWIIFIYNHVSEQASININDITNNRANVDMNNLSDVGKSTISGFSAPSTDVEILPTDTITYVAPATGFVMFRVTSTDITAYISLSVTGLTSILYAHKTNQTLTVWIPVFKGRTVSFNGPTDRYTVLSKTFVYAQGEI